MIENSVSLNQIITDNWPGGWILKDRIIPVPDCQHAEYAFKILKDLINIDNDHELRILGLPRQLQFTHKYSIYRIMYRLGFIRLEIEVIDGEPKVIMEYSQDYKPNEYQLRLLGRADQIDRINIYFKKGHENDKN